MNVPKLIFIVPYRDREMQRTFFHRHMTTYILENMDAIEYEILYIHQKDNRPFNRGAIKNIGFLIVKEKYKSNYKDITLVFNDIDTSPLCPGIFNYDTTKGIIKHFYGFKHALGGIFSIKGEDFEKAGGFPNFWSWGYEDSVFQERVLQKKMKINRDQYYPILHKNVLLLHDDVYRLVNRNEFERYSNNTNEGFKDIQNLSYEFNKKANLYDINSFNTPFAYVKEKDKQIDLRKGGIPYQDTNKMGMLFTRR